MKTYLTAALAIVAAIASLIMDAPLVAVGFMIAAVVALAIHAAFALREGGIAALRPAVADEDYDRRTSMAGSLELNNNWYND